jgi:putative membrane protein
MKIKFHSIITLIAMIAFFISPLFFIGASQTSDNHDQNFVNEAVKGGKDEVEMGNIARTKATNVRVKNFASMMIRDHTKANNELESLLKSEGITPKVDMKHTMNDMGNKTGNDFDHSYMSMMVNDHNKTINLFNTESKEGKNAKLKNFATKTLPILKMHLDSANAIYNSLKMNTTGQKIK